jgi:transcriptional regulator, araC family
MEFKPKKYVKMTVRKNIRSVSGEYHDVELHRLLRWKNGRNRSWPVYPHAVEESRRRSSFSFEESNCPYFLLVSLLEGRLPFQVESEKILMKPGKLLLVPPGAHYRFHSGGGNFYHKCVLEIKGINLLTILETLGLTRPLCLSAPAAITLFEEKFRFISARLGETDPAVLTALTGETYALLCGLALLADGKPPIYGRLNMIRERLESNLDVPVSITALAEEFHLHPVVMSRNFKKKFGYTPKEYRVFCRMEQAKYLLNHTRLSLKEIAYQLGYCSEFYFSQEFLRVTGTRPGRWRTLGEA